MKRLGIASYAVLAIALAGCRDSAQDQRIAKLEARLLSNEEVLDEVSRRAIFASNSYFTVTDSITSIAIATASNQSDVTALYGTNYPSFGGLYIGVAACEDRLDRIEAITNRISGNRVTYYQPRPQPTAAMKDGVPAAVYDGIAAAAAAQYPNDYSMQLSKIKWQVEDYKKLHQQ